MNGVEEKTIAHNGNNQISTAEKMEKQKKNNKSLERKIH